MNGCRSYRPKDSHLLEKNQLGLNYVCSPGRMGLRYIKGGSPVLVEFCRPLIEGSPPDLLRIHYPQHHWHLPTCCMNSSLQMIPQCGSWSPHTFVIRYPVLLKDTLPSGSHGPCCLLSAQLKNGLPTHGSWAEFLSSLLYARCSRPLLDEESCRSWAMVFYMLPTAPVPESSIVCLLFHQTRKGSLLQSANWKSYIT